MPAQSNLTVYCLRRPVQECAINAAAVITVSTVTKP